MQRSNSQSGPLSATVVHNAGVIRPNLLEAVVPTDLEILNRLHLVAPLLALREFLPSMKAKHFGRVISSRAAVGVVTRTAYSATKAGMIGMARTWALELAVNVVAPGPIGSTEMFHDLVPAGSEKEASIARAIQVGEHRRRYKLCRILQRSRRRVVTGQVLYVCGGRALAHCPFDHRSPLIVGCSQEF